MNYFPCLVLLLAVSGCSQQSNIRLDTENQMKNTEQVVQVKTSPSVIKSPSEANNDVLLAEENKDYRILATSGRRVTYPGIAVEKYDWVHKYCGRKFMPTTGDAITSTKQRNQRVQQIEYMRLYNEKMLLICKRNIKL